MTLKIGYNSSYGDEIQIKTHLHSAGSCFVPLVHHHGLSAQGIV